MLIRNVNNALMEMRPEYMTLTKLDAVEQKINGPEGGLKYLPRVTFIAFRILPTKEVEQFSAMAFFPKTTDEYDTKNEALNAGKEFLEMLIETKSIFTMIWNEWAKE